MHSLDVPGEHPVHGGVDYQHHHGQTQVKVIAFYWRLADGPPLDANACHLVQSKVLGAQAECRGGHQRLRGAEKYQLHYSPQ